MDFVHDGGKLFVVGIVGVDGVHGGVEVLDVLRVHDEEGAVAEHDVAQPLVLRTRVPVLDPLFQLEGKSKMDFFENKLFILLFFLIEDN